MTGGGFGGCAVVLVRAEAAQIFADQVGANYLEAPGIMPSIYVCAAARGAEVVAGPPAR